MDDPHPTPPQGSQQRQEPISPPPRPLKSLIDQDQPAPLTPQPFMTPPPIERRWQFWRRPMVRDHSEQYRPPHWWQRVFSLASLAVISITAGIMVAVAIAAVVAAVAIALQSLVT